MRTLSTLSLLLSLAACGPPGDSTEDTPRGCDVPIRDVTVRPTTLDSADTALECSGGTVSCEGVVQFSKNACPDGFAVILERGDETLVVRLQGGDKWDAGMQLNGTSFEGTLSVSGLHSPLESPPAGQVQKASFAFTNTTLGVVGSGAFTITW